jgi:hypothetical protein
MLIGVLRRDAGQECRLRVRQPITGWAAIKNLGFAERSECGIGAQTSELAGKIATVVETPGFVIVPVEGGSHDGNGRGGLLGIDVLFIDGFGWVRGLRPDPTKNPVP